MPPASDDDVTEALTAKEEFGPQTPEARRHAAIRWRHGLQRQIDRLRPGQPLHRRIFTVAARVWNGAYNDGFIHAGNLAYMALISLFPFFITAAAILSLLGEQEQQMATLNAVLSTVPSDVAAVIRPVAEDVITARSGWVLWLGGLVGLWTVGSLIETIRDILRRAYGTRFEKPFWRYRAGSFGMVIGAVFLLLISFALQLVLAGIEDVIDSFLPQFDNWVEMLSLSRFLPAVGLFASLWLVFVTLTPSGYRGRRYPKWPGALLVTGWWIAVTTWLPAVLRQFFTYDLTYGSLAGVMVALFFFWLIGLGVVVGAELNAALAESPEERDMIGQSDERSSAAAPVAGYDSTTEEP